LSPVCSTASASICSGDDGQSVDDTLIGGYSSTTAPVLRIARGLAHHSPARLVGAGWPHAPPLLVACPAHRLLHPHHLHRLHHLVAGRWPCPLGAARLARRVRAPAAPPWSASAGTRRRRRARPLATLCRRSAGSKVGGSVVRGLGVGMGKG
jgi:hypothetical protein